VHPSQLRGRGVGAIALLLDLVREGDAAQKRQRPRRIAREGRGRLRQQDGGQQGEAGGVGGEGHLRGLSTAAGPRHLESSSEKKTDFLPEEPVVGLKGTRLVQEAPPELAADLQDPDHVLERRQTLCSPGGTVPVPRSPEGVEAQDGGRCGQAGFVFQPFEGRFRLGEGSLPDLGERKAGLEIGARCRRAL